MLDTAAHGRAEKGYTMERLTYRDEDGRAHLTLYGKQMYCSTQATADCFCAIEERLEPKPPIVKANAYGWKFFYCPSCGREFYTNRAQSVVNKANYCDQCGQAVKWE